MTDNLPVPDDLPHLNLSQEEINQLRNQKNYLTEYGKQKLRELMDKDLIFYTNGKETSRIPSPTLENLTLGTKTPEIKLEIIQKYLGIFWLKNKKGMKIIPL